MYELKDKEIIIVFTGPNGAGRKTIAEMAGSTLNMKQVLSYTTRERRPTEADGVDYFFITPAQFLKDQADNQFVEVIEIDGHLYGIKSADIEKQFQKKGCIYLILNSTGTDIVKKVYGDKVKRFFIYASPETIISRQRQRGDTEEMIERYMSHYEEEMAYKSECEHTYENLDSSHTIYDVTKALEGYLQRGLLDLD
ncbi:guanylate kinase [Paenibacillus sp. MBLB4367]|uniref:guanylate kinase n=1 Tax=Paenibacillus sp. MBLB4367 TaxID=3384767 RepID=UPI003907F722